MNNPNTQDKIKRPCLGCGCLTDDLSGYCDLSCLTNQTEQVDFYGELSGAPENVNGLILMTPTHFNYDIYVGNQRVYHEQLLARQDKIGRYTVPTMCERVAAARRHTEALERYYQNKRFNVFERIVDVDVIELKGSN